MAYMRCVGNSGGGSGAKRYGYAINKTDSNPATRFIYLYDATEMTPAYMDFANGSFNYGDWADIWFVSQNKPCMVKSDGTIDYYLNPNNYAYREDGVTASDIANNTTYDGNAMSKIPLVWVKRWEVGNYECFACCQTQYDSTYKAYAHMRADGSVMDYKFISMFKGSYISGKMRSVSGQPVGDSQTADTEISYATANGSLWFTQSFSEWSLIADLLRLISRSDDAQTAFGYGRGGASSALATGTLNDKGQFFGYSAAQSMANAVKVFHIENFWGNAWNRIAGFMNLSGKIYTKAIPPYNTTGDGYTDTGLVPAGTSGGYVNLTKMTEHGRVPYNASGSATTYTCDGIYYANNQVDYGWVGGSWSDSTRLGFSCVHLGYTALGTSSDVGACLSCEQPVAT